MSQTIKSSVPEKLRSLYAPICGELEDVEQVLRDELTSEHPFVDRLVKHGFRLGGKRMRPALVLLSAKACGMAVEEHLKLGAVVELIHTATLIHDDVLDEATIRRHLDTVNARWDNEASVLLGDYLFARAICLAGALDNTFACQAIADATKAMCEGELFQVAGRGNYDLTEEEYFQIIEGKTASLCACSCRLGAYYAGADETDVDKIGRFGLYLGIAFQIADDLLDVLGDEKVTGKSLGTDFEKGKATLPLIRLLTLLDDEERNEVQTILSKSGADHRELLKPWFTRFDAIGYTTAKASEYVNRAIEELDAFQASPAIESLKGLADFVINRRQ